MEEKIELKGCPAEGCGGEGERVYGEFDLFWVECCRCDMRGPLCGNMGGDGQALADAAWNALPRHEWFDAEKVLPEKWLRI